MTASVMKELIELRLYVPFENLYLISLLNVWLDSEYDSTLLAF